MRPSFHLALSLGVASGMLSIPDFQGRVRKLQQRLRNCVNFAKEKLNQSQGKLILADFIANIKTSGKPCSGHKKDFLTSFIPVKLRQIT